MRTFALSTVALLFLASQGMADPAAPAKNDTKDRTDRKEDRTDQKEDKAKWDQHHRDHLNAALAGVVLLGNNEEVALGEFAHQKAQNEKVKQFAQMMIEHHGKYGQQLATYAPERANEKLHAGWSNEDHNKSTGEIKNDSKATERAEATKTDQPASDRERYARGFNAGDARQGGPMLEISREAVEGCLALTTEEMGRHQGAEFDKCYIGQQIGAHIGMLAKLKTFERHTQGDLQKVFRDGATETQKHLDQARAIMKELESKDRVAQTK